MTMEQLQADLATLPAAELVPNTPPWFRHLILSRRLSAARVATDRLREVDPQLATLEQQRSDLLAIRAELTTELADCAPRDAVRLRALTLSLQAVEGSARLGYEALPMPFPLFDKLTARGYTGPAHARWNPMASLQGPLPYIDHGLATLSRQRRLAQSQLERALEDSAVSPAKG